MKKKSVLSILIMIILVFTTAFGDKVFAAKSYNELASKSNVDINKSWNITFNFDVDKASVENNHDILVLDEAGTYISIKRKMINTKTIGVSPTYGYEYGKTYTLIVRESVKSTTGKNLSNEIRMNFTTKSNSNSNGGNNFNKYTVALDAGRAGNDVGNEVGPTGVLGKDINLSVAMKAGAILQSNGFNVVYTRTSDDVPWTSTESIAARSKIVNDANADILVSIHTNSWSPTGSGYEMYYLNSSAEGKKLATNIQSEMMNRTNLPNRGITPNELKTLNTVNAVGVYANLGFISNPNEEKVLATSEFQQSSAKAIANAIINYFNVEEEKTIKTIESLNVILYKGENYTLPTKVDALMSDNSHQKVNVQWNMQSVDTSQSGTFYLYGTVDGYSNSVFMQIVVNNNELPVDETTPLSKVKDFSMKVDQGQVFSMPEYVEATGLNGNLVRASVIWDRESVNTYEPGMHIVTGRTKAGSKKVTMAVMVMPFNKKPYKITIDPGHGGYDPGAIGAAGVKEKNVNLAISLKLGDILVKNGVDVVFTRISDNVPWPSNKSQELQMRCDISNEANSDYFISIHGNSMGSISAITGVETYYYRGRSDSTEFATNVLDELYTGIGSISRGAKAAGLYVTRYTNAPSILTEVEFLSNPTKEMQLNDPNFQMQCAESISRGILRTID